MRKILLGVFLGIFLISLVSFGVISQNNTNSTGNETSVCDSENLNLCLDETNCTNAGGFWYNDLCNAEAENNETEVPENNETDDENEPEEIECSTLTEEECLTNEECSAVYSEPVECPEINATGNETENNETNCTEADAEFMECVDAGDGCSQITGEERCNAKRNCQYDSDEGVCEKIRVQKQRRLNERLREYLGSDECPEGCVCAGSTIKCDSEGGRTMTVVAGRSGNLVIQTKGVDASTTVELIKNNSGLFGEFRGRVRRIRYTPDQVKDRVLKRLKMKNCEDCQIELKEDGSYEMNINRTYRILGIIPTRITEVAEVNSETGEITQVKRPWWKFLAFKSSQ